MQVKDSMNNKEAIASYREPESHNLAICGGQQSISIISQRCNIILVNTETGLELYLLRIMFDQERGDAMLAGCTMNDT